MLLQPHVPVIWNAGKINKPSQGKDPPSHTMLLPRPSFPLAQSHPLTGACSSLISLLNGPPFPFLAPCSSLHPPASHLKSQESSICCEPPNLREAALSFAHAGLAAPPPQIGSPSPACSGASDGPALALSSARCAHCLPTASCGPSNPGPPFSLLLLLCVPLGPRLSLQLCP